MKSQRINITLPYELIRDIQMNIPQGKRSEFIAKAVSEKLGKKRDIKKELIKSLKANYKLYKEEAKTWESTLGDGLQDEKW